MKYQIFAPIFLLQLINLFWYFLILRILYRYVCGTLYRSRTDSAFFGSAVFLSQLADDRSDEEDEGEEVPEETRAKAE